MSDEDLVRRLRAPDVNGRVGIRDTEAADAIERLMRERDDCREDYLRESKIAAGYADALFRAERKVEKLREALQDLMDCHHHGDFRNGVTDASGTMDEGEHLAWLVYDRARAALAETEECK